MTNEILEFLDKYPTFLATLGTCGNPRVRPFHSPLYMDNKLYFYTAKDKNLYKHISNHSGIELSSCNNDGSAWLRIRGNAKFSDDLKVKEAMFNKYELVKNIYKDIHNPNFAVFYLENISVNLRDFNGKNELIKE